MHTSNLYASWPAYRFLRRQIKWSSIHISHNFQQFVVIHMVKVFSIVNEAEADSLFLEFPCFFCDTAYVDILISGFSDFSKSSLYIWKLSDHVLLKPSLNDFEHFLANMWNECNCVVVLMFFGFAILFLLLLLLKDNCWNCWRITEGIFLFSVRPQHESAIGIHVFPLFWRSLPSLSPSHSSRLIQSPCLSFLSHRANFFWLSILHMVM